MYLGNHCVGGAAAAASEGAFVAFTCKFTTQKAMRMRSISFAVVWLLIIQILRGKFVFFASLFSSTITFCTGRCVRKCLRLNVFSSRLLLLFAFILAVHAEDFSCSQPR